MVDLEQRLYGLEKDWDYMQYSYLPQCWAELDQALLELEREILSEREKIEETTDVQQF